METSTIKPVKQIYAVDLFCGAGGLTRGLLDAGIKVRAGIDIDPFCEYPYEYNNDATCTEDGTATRMCLSCNAVVEKIIVLEKLGHDYKDGKCTICGETEGATGECKHINTVFIPEVFSTCTKEGLSAYEKCLDCGINITEPYIIYPLGHTFKEGENICCICGYIPSGAEITVDQAINIGLGIILVVLVIVHQLPDAGIDIEYMYSLFTHREGNAYMVMRVSDDPKFLSTLGDRRIKLMTQEELGLK